MGLELSSYACDIVRGEIEMDRNFIYLELDGGKGKHRSLVPANSQVPSAIRIPSSNTCHLLIYHYTTLCKVEKLSSLANMSHTARRKKEKG